MRTSVSKSEARPTSGVRKKNKSSGSSLARHAWALRIDSGLTLKALSQRSGISPATLSKIENDKLQPTYDTILKLADGLGVDISSLFHSTGDGGAPTRRSVTVAGEGVHHDAERYAYQMLNTDLATKKMTPLRARIKAGHIFKDEHLIAHDGEECVLVLSGAIHLHTEHYAPKLLNAGDCAYFDSTMGHALEAVGAKDAEIFWVCSSENSVRQVLNEVAAVVEPKSDPEFHGDNKED